MDRSKKSIIPLFLVLIAVAAYGGTAYLKADRAEAYADYIYYGTVEAEQLDISSETSGRLKEILVEEGQSVKAGDLLAVIDTPENRIKEEQAQLSLESAENELMRNREGSREEELNIQRAVVRQSEAALKQSEAVLEQTEAAVSQAEENLKSAQETFALRKKEYDDTKTLYDTGAATEQQLVNAEYAMNTARHAMENAGYSLQSSKAQLEGAKAQADSAGYQLEAAREKLRLLLAGATERSLTASGYSVAQAEKNLSLSRLTLDRSKVLAAKDGIVEAVNFSEGEYVGVGSPIISLIDNSMLRVKIFVPEHVLPDLETGKQVSIKCDHLKDRTITGEITHIASEAEFTPLNIVTKKDRMKLVYAVNIKLKDNLEGIKPGMLLDVNIK